VVRAFQLPAAHQKSYAEVPSGGAARRALPLQSGAEISYWPNQQATICYASLAPASDQPAVTDFKKPTQLLTPCLKSVWRHRAQLPNLRENPENSYCGYPLQKGMEGGRYVPFIKTAHTGKKASKAGREERLHPRETNLLFRFRNFFVVDFTFAVPAVGTQHPALGDTVI
jgi:hypothetical protein